MKKTPTTVTPDTTTAPKREGRPTKGHKQTLSDNTMSQKKSQKKVPNKSPERKAKEDELQKETSPRLPHPKEEDVALLSEADLNYTVSAVRRIGDKLFELKEENDFSVGQLLDRLLSDFYPNKFSISRVMNHTEQRKVSAGQFIELRRAFGVDLNALADGGGPLTLQQLSDAELAVRLEQITAEISRRLREKTGN